MKLTRSLVVIFSSLLAIVLCCRSGVLFTENAWAGSIIVPPPEVTSRIPFNPTRSPSYSPEINFGEFAWQAFVALNWPAGCDGEPLTGQIGEYPDSPRVWEFYNVPEQIFLPKGQDPSPVAPSVPPQCSDESFQNIQNLSQKIRLGEAAGEIDRFEQRMGSDLLDSLELLLQDVERFDRQQQEEIDRAIGIMLPSRKVLVDQSKNYVLSEIRMNPIEVQQVVNKKWYSADNLQDFNNIVYGKDANPFALVCSKKDINGTYEGAFPCLENNDVGAIELKAAWMVLPDLTREEIESKYPTYYTTKRTFLVKEDMSADGQEKQVTVPVALIAFHIVQKTSQQGWSWATFEHLDNAPDKGQRSYKPYYNLFNPDCEENCEENHPYAEKPYLWREEYPHAVTTNNKEQIPSQITRVIPITNVAKSLNEEWQKELRKITSDSIWQNYELIGVQWLLTPDFPYQDPPSGVLPSLKLANTALEPYVQTTSPGNSCIACHVKADLPTILMTRIHADFSFLLNNAQSPSN